MDENKRQDEQESDKMQQNAAQMMKQAKFLKNLVFCDSIGEACDATGINRATFYRWMATPAFAAAVSKLQEDLLMDGILPLKKAFHTAVKEILRYPHEEYKRDKFIVDTCLKIYAIEAKNRATQVRRADESLPEPPDVLEIDDNEEDEPQGPPKLPPYPEY